MESRLEEQYSETLIVADAALSAQGKGLEPKVAGG